MPDDKWYKHVFQVIEHPLALVCPQNKFVRVNHAFEKLVGYSAAELMKMTWTDITFHQDIGGELDSMEHVKRGELPNYTMLKRFLGKDGMHIPVAVTVWKFPPGTSELIGFTVEADPKEKDAETIRKEHEAEIMKLEARLAAMEKDKETWDAVRRTMLKWLPLTMAIFGFIGWLVQYITQLLMRNGK
jgi:diguanylate cyclase